MRASPPWHQYRSRQPTLWQPRMSSGLSPQPPDRLANKIGAPTRESGLPTPRPSARWRSGWPCRRAEANSRLPQKPCAAAVFTPAKATRLRLEPRARKPAGMDAHCAHKDSCHQGWPAGRPRRLACALAVDWAGALPPLHQRRHHKRAQWQPRMSSGLSPQPPDGLANEAGAPTRKSGLPTPRPSARWRSGWPCRRAEANSRLPQRPCAATVFAPVTLTRRHSEPRARKPDGMDAHCARQQASDQTVKPRQRPSTSRENLQGA